MGEQVGVGNQDSIQEAAADDFELPANNLVSQLAEDADQDSLLIPETPQKNKKNRRKRKPVISDDEDSDNEKSVVATQKKDDNHSVDTTPIQRSTKKKLVN